VNNSSTSTADTNKTTRLTYSSLFAISTYSLVLSGYHRVRIWALLRGRTPPALRSHDCAGEPQVKRYALRDCAKTDADQRQSRPNSQIGHHSHPSKRSSAHHLDVASTNNGSRALLCHHPPQSVAQCREARPKRTTRMKTRRRSS
jgi:hypothetical protein